jgi:tRNA dimethylallyltransferase
VCLDSRTVYRGLDVGTAKPQPSDQQRAPHLLLDIADPGQVVSAADLARQASRMLTGLAEQEVPAIVVGGSTLHLTALYEGLSPIPEIEPAVRQAFRDRVSGGFSALVDELKKWDAITANNVDLNNPARVLRALEVLKSTGKPLSYWHNQPRQTWPHLFAPLHLEAPRDWLTPRIDARARAMVDQGLVEETTRALSEADALRGIIGYREALDVLTGLRPLEQLGEAVAVATRRYAKRQRTYFRQRFEGAAQLSAPTLPSPDQIDEWVAVVARRGNSPKR